MNIIIVKTFLVVLDILNFTTEYTYTWEVATMLSVPISSYDPVFSLCHCNVDRLYEEWLDQYSDDSFLSYQPNEFYYDIAPGHYIDEFRVPMSPLITNRDMHNRARSLMYIIILTRKKLISHSRMVACIGRPQMVLIL